jgi:hypothetical protein
VPRLAETQLAEKKLAGTELAVTQRALRRAIVECDDTYIVDKLVGGRDPRTRLAIHRRNYETSLVNALFTKFPATHWLIGSASLAESARRFIQWQPPRAPCIAEYGEDFPAFLATMPIAERVPSMRWLAELEWHVGKVAIAIEFPALALADLADHDPETLLAARLTMQPGARYLQTPWPVDRLLELYVTESAPEQFQLVPANLCLQIHGARGAYQIRHLDPAEFAFRTSLQDGRTIEEAADAALATDAAFDPGQGVASLMAESLVTTVE